MKQGLTAYKIAAHASELGTGYSGAQMWDNAVSKVRFDFRWEVQFHLAIDPATTTLATPSTQGGKTNIAIQPAGADVAAGLEEKAEGPGK